MTRSKLPIPLPQAWLLGWQTVHIGHMTSTPAVTVSSAAYLGQPIPHIYCRHGPLLLSWCSSFLCLLVSASEPQVCSMPSTILALIPHWFLGIWPSNALMPILPWTVPGCIAGGWIQAPPYPPQASSAPSVSSFFWDCRVYLWNSSHLLCWNCIPILALQ